MIYDAFTIICYIFKMLFDSGFDTLSIITVCFTILCTFTILYKVHIDLGLPKQDITSLNIIINIIIIDTILCLLLLLILLVGTILFSSFFILFFGDGKFIAEIGRSLQIKTEYAICFLGSIGFFLICVLVKLLNDSAKLYKKSKSIKIALKPVHLGFLVFIAILYEGFLVFMLIITVLVDKETPILFSALFLLGTYPIFLSKQLRQNIIKIILKFAGSFYRVDLEINSIIDKESLLKLNYKTNNVISGRVPSIFEFKDVLIFNCESLNKIYVIDNIGFLSGSICLNQTPYRMHKKAPKYILDL